MFAYLKKRLPRSYDFYLHINRVKKIKKIRKIKQLSKEEQILYLERLYFDHIGHYLNWDELNTYTEKMQWEKIYDKNPLKVILADKFAVRNWVADKIGEEYLIPLLGTYNTFNEIDFENLPNQFVLKTNHGTGTNLVVKDKAKLNINRASRMFDDWLKTDFGYITLELHYSEIKPRIIIEKYLETVNGELQDYKFLCFDGKPYYCWVDMGRFTNHTRNVYDMNWDLQPWKQERYNLYKESIPKPKNFDKMVELASVLSEGFSHVRVDLYNVNGRIYFGEMTFTNGSGLDRIIPEQYDRVLGDLWKIDTKPNVDLLTL